MQIQKKITVTLLALAMVAPAASTSCKIVDRLIDVVEERPASVPFIPLDPLHQKMLALNIYSSTQAQQMDAESFEFFKTNYGLDFENDVPGYSHVVINTTTGIRDLFINNQFTARFLPYIKGQEKEIQLIHDSKNPLRGLVRNWYQVEPGNIVIFTRDGVFDYGTNATAQFKTNDNIYYGFLDLIRDNSSSHLPVIYEEFKTSSYQTGKTTANQWGALEYLITLKVIDNNNKEGFGISSTVNVKRPQGANGIPYVVLHNTYTWPCE